MKYLLLLTLLFLIGCTVNQKIVYNTDNLSAPETVQMIPAIVDVRIFEDNRAEIENNIVLFNNRRQVKINGKKTCVNSEKHYGKDPVVNQLSKMMVEHFNKARLFSMSFYNQGQYSNYYLAGVLNSFYVEQEFSTAAAVGAQFGLIGTLATMGVKTPGKIIIDISDLKLFTKDGTLVKDFGSFRKEYNEDFKADAHCWCAYWNANEMLKDFNVQIVQKIRDDMATVVLD